MPTEKWNFKKYAYDRDTYCLDSWVCVDFGVAGSLFLSIKWSTRPWNSSPEISIPLSGQEFYGIVSHFRVKKRLNKIKCDLNLTIQVVNSKYPAQQIMLINKFIYFLGSPLHRKATTHVQEEERRKILKMLVTPQATKRTLSSVSFDSMVIKAARSAENVNR